MNGSRGQIAGPDDSRPIDALEVPVISRTIIHLEKALGGKVEIDTIIVNRLNRLWSALELRCGPSPSYLASLLEAAKILEADPYTTGIPFVVTNGIS